MLFWLNVSVYIWWTCVITGNRANGTGNAAAVRSSIDDELSAAVVGDVRRRDVDAAPGV